MKALCCVKPLIWLVLLYPIFIGNYVSGQIISQYVETDSGTTPKGIEIWNNTGSAIDFSTNNLEIYQGTNGGGLQFKKRIDSGALGDGEVIVVGTSDIGTYLTNSGLGSVTFVSYGFAFNGDDALSITLNDVTTDVFGNPGSDPGSAWSGNGVSTANQNIQLKSDIITGDIDGWTDPSERFETVSTTPTGAGGLDGFGLPPTVNTTVQFAITESTVSEGDGTYSLILEIANESATATTCEVAILSGGSGDAADINNYTTQTLTFPASSATDQTVTLTLTDDGVFEGNENIIFEILNVSGGSNAEVGLNNEFTLTINDNDNPEISSLPYIQNFTNCEHYWTSYSEASNKDWTCASGGYFSISGYGGDVPSDDYNISPLFDLSSYSKATLSFRSSKGWKDITHPTMEILYTTTIPADTSSTVWTPLAAILPEDNDFWTWYNSGDIDLSGILGSSFYLAFHYTSSGTETNEAATWRFDDVNIVASDGDTEVYSPGIQPSADLGSTVDSVYEAQEVFKFEIEDQGTSDGLSTLVTKIKIIPNTTNTADWTDHIQGIVLKNGNTVVTLEEVVITDDLIEIDIMSGDLEISDGTSSVMTLSVYLNQTNIIDDAILSFLIEEDNHGFDEDPTGSRFSEELLFGDITSADITISVDATELQFLQQPTTTEPNTAITPAVTVAFTDVNGNRDLLVVGETIRITANNATLTGTQVDANIDATGIATFDNLVITTEGTNITLTAEDTYGWVSPTTVESEVFAVIDAPGLIISEVADPKDFYKGRFVEIYNTGSTTINFETEEYYFARQANASGTESIQLIDEIEAGEAYVIAHDSSEFKSFFGFDPTLDFHYLSGNGNDGYFLYKGGDHESGILIDSYGEIDVDGTGEAWEYEDTKAVRLASVTQPASYWDSTEWHIPQSVDLEDMTPGAHKVSVNWQGTTNTDWNTKGNNWSGTHGYIPDASFDVTISNTTYLPTISEEAATHDLTISSGVLTLAAAQSLRVFGSLSNSAGTSGLVLKADGSGPSSLIHETNGVAATVESYFEDIGTTEWYLISPPINNAIAEVYLNQYLDYWDETSAQWVDILDENTALNQGQGYSVRKEFDHLAIYTGTLNNGDIPISGLTKTTAGSYFDAGWNLVGNPYPSVLDIAQLNFGDQIIAAASVWPHGSSNTYLNWSQGSGGDIEARYIQPGQGFMIQLVSTNQSLTFTNSARKHQNLESFDKSQSEEINPNSLKISLTDQDGRSDHTYLKFDEEASNAFDPFFDVHKLFGSSSFPQIYSYIDMESGEKASIQATSFPSAGEFIPLGIQVGSSGNFTLQISGISQFEADQNFYLIDHREQEFFNLQQDSIYSIDIQVSDPPHRFDLLFDVSTPISSINEDRCQVYFIQDQLIVENRSSDAVYEELLIYNLLGQALRSYQIKSGYQIISVDLPSSFYVIQLRNQNQSFSHKVFKN